MDDFISLRIHSINTKGIYSKMLYQYKNLIWSICEQHNQTLPNHTVTIVNHLGKPIRYYNKKNLPKLLKTESKFPSKFPSKFDSLL